MRYIHLNPFRAHLVPDYDALETYAYSGHSVLLGKRGNSWQDIDYILRHFDRKVALARRRYRAFVKEGI